MGFLLVTVKVLNSYNIFINHPLSGSDVLDVLPPGSIVCHISFVEL